MYNISDNLSGDKNKMYEEILEYAQMLMQDEKDYIANLANISALLNQVIDNINWVGFYIAKGSQLVLGPFQGKAACIRIDKGRGVCGSAFESKQTQLVADVHSFPGHIACDSQSRSEIVIPIIHNNQVAAVLDIDSPILERFDDVDKEHLEKLCDIVSKGCEWENMK
ncbi:MAG: GAF domain-containing protein [Eubacteriales bacterium]